MVRSKHKRVKRENPMNNFSLKLEAMGMEYDMKLK